MAQVHQTRNRQGELADLLGMSLGQGLAGMANDYYATKAINSVLEDKSLENAPFEKRMGKLQEALRPFGERGQQALQNLFSIEQEGERRKSALQQEKIASEERKRKANLAEREIKLKEKKAETEAAEAINKKQSAKDIVTGLEQQYELVPGTLEPYANNPTLAAKVGKEQYDRAHPKAEKPGVFQTQLEKGYAKEFQDNELAISQGKAQLKNLDEIDRLIEKNSGFGGYLKNINPLSGIPEELENASFLSTAPVLKLFNPVGAIPDTKIKRVMEEFKVSKWDSTATAKAKVNSLRKFAQTGLERAEARNALILQYNGNPPPEVLKQFDKQSEEIVDAFESDLKKQIAQQPAQTFNDLPDPSSVPPNSIIKNKKTGQRMKVENNKWIPA